MDDNIHNKFRKVDPSYYIQNGQEWQGYQMQGQKEKNTRNEQMYMNPKEGQQYGQYDQSYTNYQTYQKERNKRGYGHYPNEQMQMGYNQLHQDQGSMGYYTHLGQQASMGYNPYQREQNMANFYSQNRNTMVPFYLNKDPHESKKNMHSTGVRNSMQYYPNLMYYNGQMANRRDFKGDKSKRDMYLDFNNDYLASKSIFKHSLSFKEAATAMLSMESNKKMPQAKSKTASKAKGGGKSTAKMSKTTQNHSENAITSKNQEQNIYTQEQEPKKLSKISENKYMDINEASEMRYKPISRLSDIDLHKYRNKGLQQLSQFNLLSQYTQNPNQPPTPPQSNASNFLNANYTNYIPKNVKDLIPLKKLAASSVTPTARFFPPTPKALSNIRNDQAMHKMNVVEEINLENDLLKNLKKNSISTASSLMESFQQSFSNKRKRVKNCLVEDCRHVIGEQPKIDVQFTSVDINGEKHYFLNEVLSTLLPYHLFYYKQFSPVEPIQYNYSGFADQIQKLRENVKDLAKDEELVNQQLDYSCMCEGLDVIRGHYFDIQDPDDDSSPFDE